MHEKSDSQLLREYAEDGDEASFRELVVRHTDLVYSAALRQVASPEPARDVAQRVFTDLARKARSLLQTQTRNASLSGWLYRSTRFAALNQWRDDHRRQAREKLAMELSDSASQTATDWEHVGPVLDEAMSELSDPDRDALLLRFFKNCDFRAIGESLGVSDDAAQKRVSRALEKLRAAFARRGVTTTAAALSAAISANAVSAAPAGLAAALSAASLAGTSLATAATTAAATKAIAMTTMQKALIAATLATFAGTGVYEALQASRLREHNQILQQEQAALTEQIQQLQREHSAAKSQLAALPPENGPLNSDQATAELLKLRGEVTQLRRQLAQSQAATGSANDPFTRSVLGLTARASELHQHLEQRPEKKIPELHFLGENDWLNAAKTAKFDTDADIRKALRDLRNITKTTLPMARALDAYTRANNGQLPTDLSQLKPYFKIPADEASGSNWDRVDPARDAALLDAILERYKLVQSGNVTNLPPDAWIIVEKAPVDKEYDSRAKFGIGRSTVMCTGIGEAGDPDDKSY